MILEPAAQDIVELFTDRVYLAPPGPLNRRGETGSMIGRNYPCRVEYDVKETRLNTGEVRMSHTHCYVMAVYLNDNDELVYLDDLPPVNPEWHIKLPDGSTPIIMRVDKAYYGDMSHLLIYT